jgi:hypothetical protein
MTSLTELARETLAPIDAPATYVASQIIGPDFEAETPDVDEWVALDVSVAARMALGGGAVLLRVEAKDALSAPRATGLSLEVIVRDAGDAVALSRALDGGASVRAALATGSTGIEAYRAAAACRKALGTRVPVRVRWDDVLDVKGAALALTFGADELAGPLAAPKERWKLAQVGGPAESGSEPSPSYVESLIRAAERAPFRRVR